MAEYSQIWYITGASGGLGLALAQYLLAKGDKVAATSRKLSNLESKFGKESESFLPLELDFDASKGGISAKAKANLDAIYKKWHRIDNLVNNAGYGLLGFIEEVSESQLREQFEVNIFTPFIITQNALKFIRTQEIQHGQRAKIFNLSSIGGFRVSNVSTPYCMSKFALSAFSEGLSLDLKDFKIPVINIMPAGFRTEFVGSSMRFGELKIQAYDAQREAFLEKTKAYNGKQAGNPAKFAEVIFKISRMQNPPFNLFLGDAAFKSAQNKIKFLQDEIAQTQSFAGKSVDFDDSGESVFDKR